jgi:DNA-directed RNA polymerase subunit RPC12/RpoP
MSDTVKIRCGKCDRLLAVPEAARGTVTACPACGQKLRVPLASKDPAQGPSTSATSAKKRPAAAVRSERPKARRRSAGAKPAPARQRRRPKREPVEEELDWTAGSYGDDVYSEGAYATAPSALPPRRKSKKQTGSNRDDDDDESGIGAILGAVACIIIGLGFIALALTTESRKTVRGLVFGGLLAGSGALTLIKRLFGS